MINLDNFDQLRRHKPAAIGFLLVVIGFVAGYFSRGSTPHPHQRAHPPERARITWQAPQAMGRDWRQGSTETTTVIVIENGRTVEYLQQSGPVAIATPPQNGPSAPRLLFALLALTLMPAIVWAALAWNRRTRQTVRFSEPNPYDPEFMPRRDD